MQNWKQVVVFPEAFKHPTPDKALCLNINKDVIGVDVKHVYLWLHPGNRPAVLLITPDSEIVYHVNKQGTKRQRTSVPNGFYLTLSPLATIGVEKLQLSRPNYAVVLCLSPFGVPLVTRKVCTSRIQAK